MDEKPPDLKVRTKQFALRVIRMYSTLVGGNKSVVTKKAAVRVSAVVRQLSKVASPVLCSVEETTVDEDLDGRWARFFSPFRTLGQLLALPQAACRR